MLLDAPAPAPRGLAVACVSGGLDSVTLAYWLHAAGYRLHLVSVDYGQRHVREVQAARHIARRLAAAFSKVDLRAVGALLHGSALTDPSVPVPHGHYAAETMRATVVPNRNAILLSIAWGIAVAEGACAVATAVHAGDHAIYPDCRPAFITAFGEAARVGTEGFGHSDLRLLAPFVHATKAEIVSEGARLGVPFEETWSCYEGGARHCGQCGTCTERVEAFHLAGVPDPTEYAAHAAPVAYPVASEVA